MSIKVNSKTVLASTVALGLLALAVGAMAQSGLTYAVVNDGLGNMVAQLGGNGLTQTISCANNAVFAANGCNGLSAASVVVSNQSGVPSAAARKPGITCTPPAVPTSSNGQWSCQAQPVCAMQLVRPGVQHMMCQQ